ncbi:SIS domain-containing protein [Rickettsiales bacterium]|nr:SIS domain-containing protein [Rickettsiales bacterium]
MKKKTLEKFYYDQFQEHILIAQRTKEKNYVSFKNIVQICVAAIKKNKKIIIFGNGGSASDSQHIATELTVRFSKNRKAIAAIAITTDTSALTAIGNDLGFKFLFSRQIEAIANPGDVALGITTSGQSENIIIALKQAKKMKLSTIAFCGKNVKLLDKITDQILSIPATNTSRIQEMHITVGQMLCNAIEHDLKLSTFVNSEI